MHLALLRGINVGGKNVIRMADLREAFADMGFADVRTYIQSGNVLFRGGAGSTTQIAATIERELSRRFDYTARAVVRSKRQYEAAILRAPAQWGQDPARKHNALFTLPGVRATTILAKLPPLRDDLEEATCAPGVIFWSASIQGLARTTIMKLGALPVYADLTVRNHKTTLALLERLRDQPEH